MRGSARAAQLARRRLRPAGRDDDRGGRLHLRLPLLPRYRIVREIDRTAAACTTRPDAGGVNGETPMPGGGVLVSRSAAPGSTPHQDGGLIWSFHVPVSYPSDPSRGPAAGSSSWTTRSPVRRHRQPSRAAMSARPAGSGWGALNHPLPRDHAPERNIAINDDYNDRASSSTPKQRRIVCRTATQLAGLSRQLPQYPRRDGMRPARVHEEPLWELATTLAMRRSGNAVGGRDTRHGVARTKRSPDYAVASPSRSRSTKPTCGGCGSRAGGTREPGTKPC